MKVNTNDKDDDTVQQVQARENEWCNSSLCGLQKALKTMTNL